MKAAEEQHRLEKDIQMGNEEEKSKSPKDEMSNTELGSESAGSENDPNSESEEEEKEGKKPYKKYTSEERENF